MAAPSLVWYLGAPALNREAWAVYGLFSVKAGIWMKRKSLLYREVGEILSIVFFPASWKLLRHCLSVPLLRWDVLGRWKNTEQREVLKVAM